MNLSTIISALPPIGAVAAKAPEFVKLYQEIIETLNEHDQGVARAALADIQADNDAGYERLQAKLAKAAKE